MTITYYVPLKNSCHVWGFLPSWSWEGSCWLGPLRLSILSQSTREADPPLDEQLFWEGVRERKKGLTTRNLQSAVTFCPLLLLPRASKKPCQCGTLVLYCPRFPAISRGYSYVVNHQGSQQRCPTIALWTLTFQGSLFTWVTAGNHLPQILLCSSIPSVREGVGQKAARHPGTQTSTCLMRIHLASAPRERTARARQIIFQPLPNEVDSPSTVCFHVWKPSLKHDYATKGPHRRSTLKHAAYQ